MTVIAIVKVDEMIQSAFAAGTRDQSLPAAKALVMNEQVAIHACCEPLVRPFIQAVSQRTVPLILDTTGAGRGCHLLIAAVGYYHLVLPVGWQGG